jgi:hypothetical protein
LSTLSTAKKAIIAVALLGALLVGGIALAKDSGPAAPTITAHPANPTSSTSANFTYTEEKAVNFVCALDGSAFGGCGSGTSGAKSYGGPLTVGTHTFRVEAVSGSQTSSPASFTWTIDRSPPSIALSFPSSGGTYDASGWNSGCAGGVGACGSASDPSGVAGVSVSVYQASSNRYWSGSSFSATSEQFNSAVLGSPGAASTSWRYPLALPQPDGSYTVHVRAVDKLGNSTPSGSQVSATFTINTLPPPTITSGPPPVTNQTSARFTFTDTRSGVTFLCSLDGAAYSSCASPKVYPGPLASGFHTFAVKAQNANGTSQPTSYTWVISTLAPPPPTITQHPSNPTTQTGATFAFSDPAPLTSFQCQLDAGGWSTCTSPKTYAGPLAAGSHTFQVRAVNILGNVSSPASFSWTITGSGLPFTISGTAPSSLYPGGASSSINLSLTNPNSVSLFVTSISVTVQSVTAPNATAGHPCGVADFAAAQFSGTYPFTLPPGTSTLSQLGIAQSQWPTIRMPDTSLNQDGCKSATVTLGYAGSAHS